MSGPTRKTRLLVKARDSFRCQWAGCSLRENEGELQHRRARGAGGSKAPDTNLPGNLVLLCTTHHREVESHRTDAIDRGFNVRQGVTPARVPFCDWAGFWWLLDDDGGKTCIPVTLADEYRMLLGILPEVVS